MTCATATTLKADAHDYLMDAAERWRVRLAVDLASTLRSAGLPDAAVEGQLAQLLMVAVGATTATRLADFLPAARAVVELLDLHGTDAPSVHAIAADPCLRQYLRDRRGY